MLAVAGIAITTAMTLVTPVAANTNDDVPAGAGKTYAVPEQPMGTAGIITRMTPVPSTGRVSCFGYFGTFKIGTHVMVVDWATSSDECFGIATDRTIWHTWPGSGGWTPMPGNGHADDIYPLIVENLSTGYRSVTVVIPGAAIPFWCQDYTPSTDWTGWYACS